MINGIDYHSVAMMVVGTAFAWYSRDQPLRLVTVLALAILFTFWRSC